MILYSALHHNGPVVMGAHCNILLRIIELCKVPKLFAYKPVSCHNVPLLVMNGALLTTMVETIRVLL